MGALKNKKHEAFAHARAAGMTQAQSAEAAGFSPTRAKATGCELNRHPKIARRIEELKSLAQTVAAAGSTAPYVPLVSEAVLTRKWVLNELMDNVRRAKDQDEITPANRALELLGKELGMFVDRSEVKAMRIEDLTDEMLDAMIAAAKAEEAAAKQEEGSEPAGPVVQ